MCFWPDEADTLVFIQERRLENSSDFSSRALMHAWKNICNHTSDLCGMHSSYFSNRLFPCYCAIEIVEVSIIIIKRLQRYISPCLHVRLNRPSNSNINPFVN